MYGIMSRGYICPVVPAQIIGDPPVITGTSILSPEILGSAQAISQAPTITGGAEQAPTITEAETPPAAPSPGTPSLTGGKELVPIIQSAEED